MLSYSIKLDDKSIRRDELVWSEKYLAPDLSFVSGVTSQDYHIEKKNYIAFSVGDETNAGSLKLSCENVTRNGYIKIKNKTYNIQKGSTTNYATNVTTPYSYVDIKGVIYYISAGTTSITVKNWLKEEWNVVDGEYVPNIVEGDVEATVEGDFVYLDTIVWIEDETVEIDGYRYFFDRYDISSASLSPGGIKYYEDGECLAASSITNSKDNEIYYNHFDKESDYIYVTKFKLTQKELKNIQFDKLSYCRYFYYVFYKDNYCPVNLSADTEADDLAPEYYVCDIPKRLYTKNIKEEEYYEIESFPVYYDAIDETTTNVVKTQLTTDYIDRISLLKTIDAYIEIEGIKLPVSHLLQNSNQGDELAIYLTDGTTNVSVGEVITLENELYEEYISDFYVMGGETFVLYNNRKYKVIERLCDKVMINKHEYSVEYINGIKGDVDAIVDIMGEKVPMKIVDDAGTKLERYGEIISGNSKSAVTATYDIVKHDGIDINGKKYQIYSGITESSSTVYTFVEIKDVVPFEFVVEAIEGSSLLICTPNFNVYEFDDEFRQRVNESICRYFVENQSSSLLYIKNRSFGSRYITSDIGYVDGDPNPVSSNDYYDLFNNLVLYVDTAHIHIPLKLDINVANNMMQEDLVNRDFYEVEKKKAINNIVDMEKDVYVPKHMSEKAYEGSATEFFPVSEIEVNLHFRTRNLDNWRVNDGYNDASASGNSDNWFITDYYSYNKYYTIEDDDERKKWLEALQNTSDLMGLLYFTNDDIYYQRDKVGKSFLRFSYYDSPDPTTQSLMATSTVFINEHSLFKKFIDNSRRNVYDYAIIEKYENEVTVQYDKAINNRISVMTEFMGKHDKAKKEYKPTDLDREALSGDTRRISSRMTINNKYETDTSSEGFYLYMFKEYSENLHPKPIYMKVEFNHAGIGRTIPFIVPMKWSGSTVYNNNNVNIFNPERRLRLSGTTAPAGGGKSDVELLKEGYPLSYVYAQTYIPLYAVYDYQNKEYAYVFDERYIDSPSKNNGKIVLNLFELKIADESVNTATDEERENVTKGRSTKALIDINQEQFDVKYFNKDYR